MKGPTGELRERYAAALREYLQGAEGAALLSAYEMGRDTLGRGGKLAELVAAYQEALQAVAVDGIADATPVEAGLWSLALLQESLGAADMAFQGYLAVSASLSESRARLAEAQQLAHLGSLAWDVGTGAVSWSDELFRIYGHEPRAITVTATTHRDAAHPDDRAALDAAPARAASTGRPIEIDFRLLRPSGEIRIVHSRLTVTSPTDTDSERALWVFLDITERDRVQRELDEMKNLFIRVASHDMRNPLATILAGAGFLAGGDLPPDEVRQLAAAILRAARRLDDLVGWFVDAERLRQDQLRPDRQPTDLSVLTGKVLAETHLAGHPLTTDLRPVVAAVDARQVERIIANLLTNAVRHTPPGTPIVARVEPTPAGALITVDDAGPGVADALKESIFTEFHTGGGPTSGTGVGLWAVRRLAELHDGGAWVDDRPGGGASFKVLIPNAATEPCA